MDKIINRRGLLGLLGAGIVAGVITVPTAAEAAIRRWNRTSLQVVNQLGSAWPVAAALTVWDRASALDLVAVTKIDYGASNIIVRFGRLPAGVLGECSVKYDGLYRYKQATVVINDRISKSYPYSLKLLLLRHEIGHALGFAHTTKRDVMNQRIDSSGVPLPGMYHVSELQKVYGS